MPEVALESIAGADAPKLNVVFVHGLGGDSRGTWTFEQKAAAPGFWGRHFRRAPVGAQSVFWPRWLAEDVDGLSVYSVNYPANKMGWNAGWPLEEAATSILDKLVVKPELRKSATPIVFVCHSFGGLVVKQLVMTAHAGAAVDQSKRALLDRIAGVVFLATPHDGSTLATLAGQFGWAVTDTMRDLVANSAKLGNLSDNYRDHVEGESRRIRHKVYYEKERVGGVTMVVDSRSANPGLAGSPRIPIGRDHINICKIADRNDQVYEGVRAFLEEALGPRLESTREKVEQIADDTAAIRANVERSTASLAMNAAEKEALAVDLAKVQAQYGGTVELVSGFLETMVGRKVPPEQFPTLLFKIAADWKTAGEKIDALSFSNNLQPRLAAMRDEAKAAHVAGRLDEAESLLTTISQEEIAALSRLEDHRRELCEEIGLRRKGAAETKAAQAAIAHARLNYRDAATLYGEAAALVAEIDAEAQAKYLFAQATELYLLGNEFGVSRSLREAVDTFRQCLRLLSREQTPEFWAGTHNDLGYALLKLGEREVQREIVAQLLQEAMMAFRAAQEIWTRESAPERWAGAEDNVGIVFQTLGRTESGTERLEKAVAAYRAALEIRTREHAPENWATTQSNLGNALWRLGERESGTKRLEEAANAFRSALAELSHAHTPMKWALVQNNLGNVLRTLGERQGVTTLLEEAAEAHRAALTVYSPQRTRILWAMVRGNLGTTLLRLGERETSQQAAIQRLQEAVTVIREVANEASREQNPPGWALAQNCLGVALMALGQRESQPEISISRFEEAIAAFTQALTLQTRHDNPINWAMYLGNQGIAMTGLAERKIDAAMAETAVSLLQVAIEAAHCNGHAPHAAAYEGALSNARTLVERLKHG